MPRQLRPHADPAQGRRHAIAPLVGRADAVHDQRLGDDLADRHARIERGVGVLENELHVAAQLAHLGCRIRRQFAPLEPDGTVIGLDQPDDQPAGGGLAAAAFTDKAEGTAAPHRKVEAVDGAHPPPLAPEHAAANDEVLGQPLHIQQRRLRARAVHGRASCAAGWYLGWRAKQRTPCSGSTGVASGCSSKQC
jgi:hypothetical protein